MDPSIAPEGATQCGITDVVARRGRLRAQVNDATRAANAPSVVVWAARQHVRHHPMGYAACATMSADDTCARVLCIQYSH
jgi:hypothetical protein